ncbi:hypothetical protein F511_22788 [Dorcoceras hygrometricum]|uniref:Uncharacterized protein n=1 Tax=Dorcoceras hygrometricum TaxID=472368 RepID=A0A2Z7BDZ3_9LAMI|nr:hypothetical protein F511_22788 [Dorcoceras hygrometricum]
MTRSHNTLDQRLLVTRNDVALPSSLDNPKPVYTPFLISSFSNPRRELLFTEAFFPRIPSFSVEELSVFGGAGFLVKFSFDCYPFEAAERPWRRSRKLLVSGRECCRALFEFVRQFTGYNLSARTCYPAQEAMRRRFVKLKRCVAMFASGSSCEESTSFWFSALRLDCCVWSLRLVVATGLISIVLRRRIECFGGAGFIVNFSFDCYPFEAAERPWRRSRKLLVSGRVSGNLAGQSGSSAGRSPRP